MSVIMQASLVGDVQSSVASLFSKKDLVFIIDLILSIPLLIVSYRFRSPVKRKSFLLNLLVVVVVFIAGVYLVNYSAVALDKNQPHILSSMYDRSYVVQNIGLLNYQAFDVAKYVKEEKGGTKAELNSDVLNKLQDWFVQRKGEQPQSPALFGVGKDKNLIVIQVEALQEFVINKKVNGLEITPNLNKLIKESIYFDNYYCETGLGGTSDAELLANTSLFPIKDGSAYMRYSGNDFVSLPKTMKENDYDTMVMHAFKPGFWNRSVMYPRLGFDEFINKQDYKHDEIVGMGVSDKSFFRQSLERMKEKKKPFYSFMITLSSHFPYDNDKQFYSEFDVAEYENTFFGNYLESIHYTDEAIGDFVEELKRNDMFDNTVLAIYGDHYGISKDKKDVLAKFLEIENMNDFNWVKLQKVPMLIRLPEGKNPKVNHIASGGVDFMPTILNIMGIENKNLPMLGTDLMNAKEGIAIMRNGYFIDDKYLSLTADGVAFDIKTGKEYPIDNLKDKIAEVKKRLHYSDIIIENNIMEKIRDYLKEKAISN